MTEKEAVPIKRNYRNFAAMEVILSVALLLTIWFIFSNSMETAASSSNSSRAVLEFLQGSLRRLGRPGLAARLSENLVRKAAHYCEYSLLGFWLMSGTRLFSDRLRHAAWPALLGVLTALSDETIQLFYAGRGSRVTDVWIDFAGVLTGMLVSLALAGLWRALTARRRPPAPPKH